MVRFGDCPRCAGIGEELPGVRCGACGGAGAIFICRNLECASTPSERTPPAAREPVAPPHGHAPHGHGAHQEPDEEEMRTPTVRYDLLPPPERARREYHAGEHCFEDGRCLACGKLEMLAARYGWRCQERGHFR
jgi:hypothetical protein